MAILRCIAPCALVILAALLRSTPAAAAHNSSTASSDLFVRLDSDGNGLLDVAEVELMMHELRIRPGVSSGACESATTLVRAVVPAPHAATVGTDDFPALMAHALDCAMAGVRVVNASVRVDAHDFTCTPQAHDDDHHHDDHDDDHGHHHRRRLLSSSHDHGHGPRRSSAPSEVQLRLDTSSWDCVAAVAQPSSHGHPSGTTWALVMAATVLAASCSLLGAVVLYPCRTSLRRLDAEIAAVTSGALVGGAMLHMLPEAVEETGEFSAGLALLFVVGFVLAMAVEVVVHQLRDAALALARAPHGAHVHAHAGCVGDSNDDSGCSNAPRKEVELAALEGGEELAATEAAAEAAGEESGAVVAEGEAGIAAAAADDASSHRSLCDCEDAADATMESAVVRATAAEAAPRDEEEGSGAALRGVPVLVHCAPVQAYAYVIIIGDLLHNAVDGLAIAAAFSTCSHSVGWSVTLAVLLHEVPQEIGDFALLMKAGMSMGQALLWNVVSSLSAIVAAIAVLIADGHTDEHFAGNILAFGAGTLMYIGAADVLPDVFRHRHHQLHSTKAQGFRFLLHLLGIAAVGLVLLHHPHC